MRMHTPPERPGARGHDIASSLRHRPAPGVGRALAPSIRSGMESAFGADFSDVRIHEGPDVARMGAVALTRLNHVHFAPGAYRPHSAEGQMVLRHELAHVVQQRAGRVPAPAGGGAPINGDPRLEAEAHAMAGQAGRGAPVQRVTPAGRGPTEAQAPAGAAFQPLGALGWAGLGLGAYGVARLWHWWNQRGPAEPYNRRKHYGNTPTKADRAAIGAGAGQVADHNRPLVQRYYEGQHPWLGAVLPWFFKPGYAQTDAERRASAADRSKMEVQARSDSDKQGGEMRKYSMARRKQYFGY